MEAFGELDRLAADLANRLAGSITNQDKLPPAPAGPSPDRPGGGGPTPPIPGEGDGKSPQVSADRKSCGTREDIELRVDDLDARYEDLGETILGVNNDLSEYRIDVRDGLKLCTPQLASAIASSIKRLRKIDIDADSNEAVELSGCVDQLRREVKGKIQDPATSEALLQYLSGELQRVDATWARIQDMELALELADNKRRRLTEELKQNEQVIEQSRQGGYLFMRRVRWQEGIFRRRCDASDREISPERTGNRRRTGHRRGPGTMPMRRTRRQAAILDRGSPSSLRTLSVAAVAALTLATPAIGVGQATETSANPLVAGDIKESYAEIDKILLEMEGAHVNGCGRPGQDHEFAGPG